MSALVRLEAWSDYQCASGTRQSIIPLNALHECTTNARVSREDSGQIVVGRDAPGASSIALGGVVRFLFDDDSFDEWRVVTIDDESRASRTILVRLRSPLADLANLSAILSETTATIASLELEWGSLTPATQVSKILAFCPAYWTAGTISPVKPVTLKPQAWMPLKALRELVSAIRAQGDDSELDYDRNGTTGYRLHIRDAIGGTSAALDVRTGKNLLSTRRTQDRAKFASEVVPLGMTVDGVHTTMADGWLEVTNKATNVLTVQQPVTAGRVIFQNDQWNGLYLTDDAGALQQITDSVGGATQTLTVASGTNFTSGRWYRYALNSSGDELIRLRALEATPGFVQVVEAPEYDNITNLVGNPAMTAYTNASSIPDNWSQNGTTGTYSKATTVGLWVQGGQSCRIQTGVSDAGHIESPPISLYVPSWATNVHFSMWIRRVTDDGINPEVNFWRDTTQVQATSVITLSSNVWHRVMYSFNNAALVNQVHSYKVRYEAGTSAEAYVDSAQITFSSGEESFREGSDPTRLLAVANRYLTRYNPTPTTIAVSFADLAQWDPVGFAHHDVTLGQTVNVRDTVLNLTTSARLMELQRDWKRPLQSVCSISSTPDDLTTALTGI